MYNLHNCVALHLKGKNAENFHLIFWVFYLPSPLFQWILYYYNAGSTTRFFRFAEPLYHFNQLHPSTLLLYHLPKDFRASGLSQVRRLPAATAAITLARLFAEMLCNVLW